MLLISLNFKDIAGASEMHLYNQVLGSNSSISWQTGILVNYKWNLSQDLRNIFSWAGSAYL